MRLAPLLPLVLAVCACGDAPQASPPASPPPAAPTGQDGALAQTRAQARAQALALAAAAHTDDGRAALDELEPARRVAVLRAGLELPPGPAPAACARALDWKQLDAGEQRLATRHLIDEILRPVAEVAEVAEREFWHHVLDHVSSDDLDPFLARMPGPDPTVLERAGVGTLHKVARPRHLLRLAELLGPRDDALSPQFHDLVTLTVQCTDQHREAAARVLLGDARASALPSGSGTGVPPLLRACLEELFLNADANGGGIWGHWAARWLRDVIPNEDDADLLVRLDDAGYHDDLAVWQMRHLDDDLTRERLLELADFGDPDPASFQMFAWGALAVRGDERGLRSLRPVATREGIALALTLQLDPRGAREALAGVLLDPALDDDWRGAVAVCFAALDEARWEARDHYGIEWDEGAFDGFEDRALASNVDGMRLARIGHAVPGCRTRRLAAEAARRLRRNSPAPPDTWRSSRFPVEALGVVETGAPAELRRTLRAWAATGDESARRAALETLLFLGDPETGPELVAELRAGRLDPRVGDAGLERLALSRCDAVSEFLRAVVSGDEPPPRGATRWQAVWGLARLAGLPEGVAFELPDGAYGDLEANVAERVLDGRALDAYAALLAAAPDAAWKGAGDVDDPRVTAYLRRLRDERHLGHHPFAVAELAIQGDAAARAEQEQALGAGHYRWAQHLDARQMTFGWDFETVPALIETVESNDCLSAYPLTALYATFGLPAHRTIGYGSTEAAACRRWWDEHEGPFVWSRMVEKWVVEPR